MITPMKLWQWNLDIAVVVVVVTQKHLLSQYSCT
jgi:hypothetical protein